MFYNFLIFWLIQYDQATSWTIENSVGILKTIEECKRFTYFLKMCEYYVHVQWILILKFIFNLKDFAHQLLLVRYLFQLLSVNPAPTLTPMVVKKIRTYET